MKKTNEELGILGDGVLPDPKPVALITCGTTERPNIVTVSYLGQVATNRFFISLRRSRLSNKLIRKTKEFAINFPTADLVKEVDFCGTVSGRKEDKFRKTKLTMKKAQQIQTPLVKECPLNIECKLEKIINAGSHDLFIGKVIAISKANKRKPSWIFHQQLNYYENGKKIGAVYKAGKQLPK